MNCPRCGFEQHIGATFCPNCGWLLQGGENPDDFWRIDSPATPPLKKSPKRRRRKGQVPERGPQDRRETRQPPIEAGGGPTRQAEQAEAAPSEEEEPHKLEAEAPPSVVDRFAPSIEEEPILERPIMRQPEAHGSQGDEAATLATPQAPAVPRGERFVVKPPKEVGISRFVWPALALLVGFMLGASLMYILSPPKEYIVLEPLPTPSPQAQSRPVGGLVPIPVPQTSPGPVPAPGPDMSAQNDLRNALIAEKKYYARAGQYTADIETLAKEAPHVVWEPGVTPSRAGVVAVMVCGGPDPSAPLMLQALGPTGRYYGIYDVPSGPASAVYYAMSQQSFNCPNSSPPQPPWMDSLAGWGTQQPRVSEPTPGPRLPEPSPPSDQDILGGTTPPPSTPAPQMPRSTLTPQLPPDAD